MKTIYSKLLTIAFIAILLTSCSKSGDNNASPVPPVNTGAVVSNAVTYTGSCTSVTDVGTGGALGNIDVAIVTTSGVSFFIYNMPQESSGTYSFNDGYNNAGGSVLYGLFLSSSAIEYATSSGTITKTGANSFTFSCVVYYLGSNSTISLTGKGNY